MSMSSQKQSFLKAYDQEHATTLKVLRAFPADRLDLRPHEKCKNARELAWVFVMERGLGEMVFRDEFPEKAGGSMPEAPEAWDDVLAALEQASARFRAMVAETPPEDLEQTVRFYTGPKTMGEIPRMDWLWFLLHDEIHHRGQFSIYLRMADAKVPSIYGPSADEPWM